MIFSSASFLFFFLFVAAIHWYIVPGLVPEKHRLRVLHLFLLFASYFFYMSWDWQFGFLIAFSTLVDYFAGLYMDKLDREKGAEDPRANRLRRLALLASILTNLGVLGYFKYTDFFIGSFVDLINGVAPNTFAPDERNSLLLNLILPLGISFFTFQSMSYTIDTYRRVIPAEKNFIRFALYVSFFPQLVAGPIVVARGFLPQLQKMPEFDLHRLRVAARWFALGYFKKVVLADNAAPVVDAIFATPMAYDAGGHWIGALGFWVQVYGDFSGYSDMAWGTAIFLGFNLPENFRMPYLSRSDTEHWQRWHMSLIMWIRDYLYIPLGGNRAGYLRHKFNVFITMFLAGVWHGANWTFVVWGTIHGVILTVESAIREWLKKRADEKAAALAARAKPAADEAKTAAESASMAAARGRASGPVNYWPAGFRGKLASLFALCATSFCTIYFGTLFRAQSISDGWLIFRRLLGFADPAVVNPPHLAIVQLTMSMYRPVLLGTACIIIGHALGWLIFEKKKQIKFPAWLEIAAAPALILLLIQIGASGVSPFIYFVF